MMRWKKAACVAVWCWTMVWSAWASAATPSADPTVWGVYARLIGQTWETPGGYWVRVDWLVPDASMSEQWINPSSQKVNSTVTLTPGTKPGELIAKSSPLPMKWIGQIVDADTMLFSRNFPPRFPFQLHLSAEGVLDRHSVSLDDGKVTSIDSTMRFTVMGAPATSTAVDTTAVTPTPTPTPTLTGASASAKPAPAPAPVIPTEVDPGPFTPFLGRWVLSVSDRRFIEFARGPDGTLIIQFYFPSGENAGRYVIAMSKNKPGELELRESAYGDRFHREAAWLSEDELTVSSRNFRTSGIEHNYTFRVVNDQLVTRRWGGWVNILGLSSSNDQYEYEAEYQTPNDARVAAAAEGQAQDNAQEEQNRLNRIREREQQDAMFAAALGGFANDFNQAMADSQRAEERQQVFLADTREQTEAIAAWRVQQQRQEAAAQARAVAESSRGAAAPSPTSAKTRAPVASASAKPTANGMASPRNSGLVIEAPKRPEAARPTASASSAGQVFVICSFINHKADADRMTKKYVSQIAAVDGDTASRQHFAFTGSHGEPFMAKLQSQYDISLGPGSIGYSAGLRCDHAGTRQGAEMYRQQVVSDRGFRIVETAIVP